MNNYLFYIRFLCYLPSKLMIIHLLTSPLYDGMIFVIEMMYDAYTNMIAPYYKLQIRITLYL
jgi:hypothetical protein